MAFNSTEDISEPQPIINNSNQPQQTMLQTPSSSPPTDFPNNNFSMDPFISTLYNRISQLEFDNQRNSTFLLHKINGLESQLQLPLSTKESLQQQLQQFQLPDIQPYQPQPQQSTLTQTPPQPPVLFNQQQQQYFQMVPPQQQQQVSQPPMLLQPINVIPSISFYANGTFRYINGSGIPVGTRAISLGYEFAENWNNFTKNLLVNPIVDTLILLDGFNQEIHPGNIPNTIKTIHIGFLGPLAARFHNLSIPNSVQEVHLHDGCNILLTRGTLPISCVTLHVYNVIEPLTKGSIGGRIENLFIHDGFNKSLGHDIIPNSVHSLHLFNINVSALSMPIGLHALYLHNGFNLPITISTISKNVKELHLFNIGQPLHHDSIPVSVRTLYLYDGFAQAPSLFLPQALKNLYMFNITYPVNSQCLPHTLTHIYLQNYKHTLECSKKINISIL